MRFVLVVLSAAVFGTVVPTLLAPLGVDSGAVVHAQPKSPGGGKPPEGPTGPGDGK
jgi:hypothetical protein